MQVRSLVLGASLAFFLAACGGGGSGGDPKQPEATPEATDKQTSDMANASAESLTIADFLLGLSKAEVSAARASMAAASNAIVGVCSNLGGLAQFTWTDANANEIHDAGDMLTITYNNCAVLQTGSALTGTIQVSIASASDTQLDLSVDYGEGLQLVDLDDKTPSHVYGTKSMRWTEGERGRDLMIMSSGMDDLRLATINSRESSGRIYTEQIKSIRISNNLDRSVARYNSTLSFRLISEYYGQSFDMVTSTSISGDFNTVPDAGEVIVLATSSLETGAIRAKYTSDGTEMSFHVSADRRRYDLFGAARWSALTTGVLSWGEDISGMPEFDPAAIRNLPTATGT